MEITLIKLPEDTMEARLNSPLLSDEVAVDVGVCGAASGWFDEGWDDWGVTGPPEIIPTNVKHNFSSTA